MRINFQPTLLKLISPLLLVGCGGGGGGDPTTAPGPGGSGQTQWVAGQFLEATTFEDRCVVPRTTVDPVSGNRLYADVQGTLLDENNWLRSWSNDLYLWFDEIIDQDPSLFTSTGAYFDTQKTNAQSPTGSPKDRFHFTWDTNEWIALAQSGVSAGYGVEFALLRATPPREIVVAFSQPGSPATAPGVLLTRGTRIIGVDGVDAVNGNTQAIVDVLNAGIFPSTIGEQHNFEVLDPGATTSRFVTISSAEITATPVQNVSTLTAPSGAKVGYFLFNDHIATAEEQLITAIETLDAESIEDLIVDLRYNGGGFLGIASELAYMIAGSVPTAGRAFETLEFNSQHPITNPVTGAPLSPLPFASTTIGFANVAPNVPLPTLDLPRVFVITAGGTCSASESIINSLRGVGIQVIQIGERTCGKPYGFYPTDNCGTTYFSIQFRGINEAGFGDYSDGFIPANGGNTTDTILPGCIVADDFNNPLGDIAEANVAAALQYRDTGTCPVPQISTLLLNDDSTANGLAIEQPPTRNNRFFRD